MTSHDKPDLRRLLEDKKTLQSLSRSPDARALVDMVTRERDQASLQRIVEDAARGETAQLSALVRSIAESPGGAQLLRQLSQSIGRQ